MSRPSLETYIQKKYYNLLFAKARAFLIEHREEIDLSTRNIRNPRNYIELIDIDVYAIYTSMLDNNRLEMEIVVTAFVEVSERYKGELEVDEKTIWLSMVTEVVLDNGIQSFVVQSVDLKEQNRRCSRLLSRSGVPYIKKTDFDELANTFLAKYYPQALKSPTKIDVTELAVAMGLTIIETKLSSDFSIFGKMVFKDTEIETYDANNQAIRRLIKKGTICADEEVSQKRNIGSLNNTIIHECVHWEFHRIYHELRMLVDETHDSVSCRTQENLSDVANWTDLDWMEWQANNLAPKILMPKKQTRQKIDDLYRALSSIYSDLSKIEVTTEVVDSLANFFGVSRQAAKIRMIELGYKEAHGVYNYLDDRYLRNYSFELDAFKDRQTYTISFTELCFQYFSNARFKEAIDSQKFLFVDNHVCLNNDKYIETYENTIIMTDYAYEHMDECCLRFTFSDRNAKKTISSEEFSDYVLNRTRVKSAYDIKVDFMEDMGNNGLVESLAPENFKRLMKKVVSLLKETPALFQGALKFHRKRKDCPQDILAEAIRIDVQTYRQYEKDEEKIPPLSRLVAIAVTLKLFPNLSEDLVTKAGYTFRLTEKDIALKVILNSCYMKSIEECEAHFKEVNPDFTLF
ncbi:XRE family transcriptional regulator [Streptococcus suis]